MLASIRPGPPYRNPVALLLISLVLAALGVSAAAAATEGGAPPASRPLIAASPASGPLTATLSAFASRTGAPLSSVMQPYGETQPPPTATGFFGVNAERPHIDVFNSDMALAGDDSSSSHVIEATVSIGETSAAGAGAGLVLGADAGRDEFYFFGVFPNEDRWRLFIPGALAPLEGPFEAGLAPAAYHLKASISDDAIALFIDGVPVGVAGDEARVAGAAGLRIKQCAARFSEVKIDGAPVELADLAAGRSSVWSAGEPGAIDASVLLDAETLASPEFSPQLDERFRMISEMGATQVRFMLSWAEIQPQGPAQPFAWRYADAFAIAAHRFGLEILPVAEFTPRWAVAPEHRQKSYYQAYPPVAAAGGLDPAGFAAFTAAAARRYSPGGDLAAGMGWSAAAGQYGGQARRFEVGAEFNLGMIYEYLEEGWTATNAGWLGGLPEYVDLLKAGRDAVKSACPGCAVLHGAAADDTITNYDIGDDPGRNDGYEIFLGEDRLLNPDGTTAWRQTVWQGIDDLYDEIERRPPPANLPAAYFDAVNIHTFFWKGYGSGNEITADRYVDCSYYSDACRRQWYETRIGEVLRVMQEHGDARDLYLTETGFPSARPPNDALDFLGHVSEMEQAAALETVYAVASQYPQVRSVCWWQGYDSEYTGYLGLIRDDLSGKPAYAKFRWLTGRSPEFLEHRFFPWYDNVNAASWLLMASPASAGAADSWFELDIAGEPKTVPGPAGLGPGQVPPGVTSFVRYPGLIGGPVNVGYHSGSGAVLSQRILWAGRSLEEQTPGGAPAERLLWSWYDESSPGYKDWLVIANPNMSKIYYTVKIAGAEQARGEIESGKTAAHRFAGVIGGPVELAAWYDAHDGGAPAPVSASQRVLISSDTALSETPGVAPGELATGYHWPWYDMQTPGSGSWILIANPDGYQPEVYYEIKIGNSIVLTGGPIAAGATRQLAFPGIMGGPVRLKTFSDPARTSEALALTSIRSLWGPSLEELPGRAGHAPAADHHWTWYDMKSPASRNWILIANPQEAHEPVYYQVSLAGSVLGLGGPVAPGTSHSQLFKGSIGGPLEVRTYADAALTREAPAIASQRVLWNGYLNELLGSSLEP